MPFLRAEAETEPPETCSWTPTVRRRAKWRVLNGSAAEVEPKTPDWGCSEDYDSY